MALTAQLSRAGITPRRIHAGAQVKLEKVGEGFSITEIDLETQADIPGIDNATFQKYALDAKQSCPVSKALAATKIHLNASLVNRKEQAVCHHVKEHSRYSGAEQAWCKFTLRSYDYDADAVARCGCEDWRQSIKSSAFFE